MTTICFGGPHAKKSRNTRSCSAFGAAAPPSSFMNLIATSSPTFAFSASELPSRAAGAGAGAAAAAVRGGACAELLPLPASVAGGGTATTRAATAAGGAAAPASNEDAAAAKAPAAAVDATGAAAITKAAGAATGAAARAGPTATV